jgi:hypothetical protein
VQKHTDEPATIRKVTTGFGDDVGESELAEVRRVLMGENKKARWEEAGRIG